MMFLSNQTESSDFAFLLNSSVKNSDISFRIEHYNLSEDINNETMIMVDNIEDAHNKCIDMIIENLTIYEQNININYLDNIANQVAKKCRRGYGNIIFCNKNDILSFVSLKLTGYRNYTFIVDKRINVGHILSIYSSQSRYDAIGAIIYNSEKKQYWLKLQNNYLDYCCLAKFNFDIVIIPI